MIRTAAFLSLLLLLVGCSQTHTYDLTVINQTPHPVTLWLCKNGPPYEDSWLAPEEVVQNSPHMSAPIGGAQIDAGRTAHTDIKGQFDSDTSAILRIYNTTGFDNILAISRGMANRIDMPLAPGTTRISVTDDHVHGGIQANTDFFQSGP